MNEEMEECYMRGRTTLVAVAFSGDGVIPNYEAATYYEIYLLDDKGRKVRRQMFSAVDMTKDDIVNEFRRDAIDVVIARNYGPKWLHQFHRHQIRTCVFDGGPNAAIKALVAGTIQEM